VIDPGSIAPVLDLLPDPVVVLDERMCVVAANRLAVTFLGRRIEESTDEPPLGIIHPDDLPLVLSSFEEMLGKDVGTPIEVRVLAADGAWRLCEVVGSTWHHAGGTWQFNTFRDLTERRRWEVAATDTARFRTIIESAAVVVILLDGAGTIESASGAMCRQLGHDPTNVVG
jgi:PAS domain S-box-containing protein